MQRRWEQLCRWSFLRRARLAAERERERGKRGVREAAGGAFAFPRDGTGAPWSSRCPWPYPPGSRSARVAHLGSLFTPVSPFPPPPRSFQTPGLGEAPPPVPLEAGMERTEGRARSRLVPEAAKSDSPAGGARGGHQARHRLPGRCPWAGRRLARSRSTTQSSSRSLMSAGKAEALRAAGLSAPAGNERRALRGPEGP